VILERTLEQARPARRRWRAWTNDEPALVGLSWQGLRYELRHGPPDRQDELLCALIRVARSDGEAKTALAACLVPGIRARIARYAPGLPPDDAWSVAVEGLCAAIGAGDVPRTFVANRLLDAAKRQLQQAVKNEAVWQGQVRQLPNRADHRRVDEPSGALILGTTIRAGVISKADAALLHATAIAGHGLAYAARRLSVSYETAKKRRQRAGHRWVAWWAPEHLEASSTPTAGEVA
jgi:hypothetical protein